MGVASTTIPKYRPNDADRATQEMNITSAVQTALAQYPITVAITRPAAGPYVMVVFGGTNTQLGTQYAGATANHDCGDTVKNDVAWVADNIQGVTASNYALGGIGWALGLDGTTDPTDCMCQWASTCTPNGQPCTLHGSLPSSINPGQATSCKNGAAQDEIATYRTAFCS
jgi:hypothetical protein